MADVSGNEIAPWLQAGGLLAFASAIWWEIRQLRPFYKSISEDLAILKDRLANAPIEIHREQSRPTRAVSPALITSPYEDR